MPKSTDSVIEVRVKMYVFKPTVGVGTWSTATTARAQNALRIVDSIYSHIAVNTLSLYTGTVAYIPHARLKFVLVGNLNIISNDSVYSYMPSAQWHSAYNDTSAINVYYGRAFHNGFYPNGDSAYWAQSSVDPPYPNNHVYQMFGRPSTPSQYDLGDIAYGQSLAHELGHALGLYHSTAKNPNDVAYGGYSYINSNFGCCVQIAANDYRLENPPGWNPCGTANSSNNLMQETNGCNQYLSPQQMAIIHYNLVALLPGMLTTKGYNDATTVNHSSDYSVTANETWTSDRYFKGDIIVKANKNLTVKCLLAMTRYAKIVVEPGAVLTIDGGTITNISGRLWDGIYITGNPGQAQLTPNASNPGSVLHQGLVRIKNGGTISQAMIGVRNYYNNYQGGGIIFAQDANFINNVIDVKMDDPHAANSLPIPSASWFFNCNFITNDTIGSYKGGYYTPDKHVLLYRVSAVKFKGCVFQYSSTINSNHGMGIYSVDANYIIDKNLNDSCRFKNLLYGIYINNVTPLKVPTIANAVFEGNLFYAAYIMNAYYLSFSGNRVTLPYTSNTSGLYLNQCKYYKIRNNAFNQLSGQVSPGISVYRSKTGAHEVYRNTFSNLLMGINCMDDNGSPGNADDGLKMNCNRFNISPNAFDIVLSYSTGLAMPRVCKTQGQVLGTPPSTLLVRNIYGATCNGNQNKWQIYSGATYTIDHGSNTNSLTAVTQPTATGCKSSYLNVVDKGINLNYPVHCPVNPLSSGGTSTVNTQRLSDMNTYLSTLRANPSVNFFEIQSTLSSKLNLFLTDSLNMNADSVIHMLETNEGAMEDADIQTVFAYMYAGDYTTALTKADNLDVSRADWAAYLKKLIALQTNTTSGIYSLNSNGTDRGFVLGYATTDGKDGQASAQALLKEACDSSYSEPHALPEGYSLRMMDPQVQNSSTAEKNDNISVFPNPTQTGVTISYRSDSDEPVKIELRDLVGKVICAKFSNKEHLSTHYISLEHLSSGMYLLSITRNKEVIYKEKIIKE